METRSGDLGGIQRHCVTLPGFSKVTIHLDWNLARNVNGNKKDCPRHFISKRKTRETVDSLLNGAGKGKTGATKKVELQTGKVSVLTSVSTGII